MLSCGIALRLERRATSRNLDNGVSDSWFDELRTGSLDLNPSPSTEKPVCNLHHPRCIPIQTTSRILFATSGTLRGWGTSQHWLLGSCILKQLGLTKLWQDLRRWFNRNAVIEHGIHDRRPAISGPPIF
eukprot:106812-Amphidinium_carterae.1